MDDAPATKKGRTGFWISLVSALVVLYLLSPVPVAIVLISTIGYDAPEFATKAYGIVYLPIMLLSEACPPVKEVYDLYFQWGSNVANLPPPP